MASHTPLMDRIHSQGNRSAAGNSRLRGQEAGRDPWAGSVLTPLPSSFPDKQVQPTWLEAMPRRWPAKDMTGSDR